MGAPRLGYTLAAFCREEEKQGFGFPSTKTNWNQISTRFWDLWQSNKEKVFLLLLLLLWLLFIDVGDSLEKN